MSKLADKLYFLRLEKEKQEAEKMKNNMAYVAVIDGPEYRLGIAKAGETGYYKTDLPTFKTWREASDMADRFNSGLGLDKKEAAIIVIRSMKKEPETFTHDDLMRLSGLVESEIYTLEKIGESGELDELVELTQKIERMILEAD